MVDEGLELIFLAGPTASGKSELALALAESKNAEIISVDSMQVYRGLDIGTAKPSHAEQQRVAHHLIDVAALHEPFDVAQFVRLAAAAVEVIRARGRRVIFCGGTGLYFRGYLRGLGHAPAGDATLRAELEKQPLDALIQEIFERDPALHATIDRKNPRRVVRAVEVMRLTGRTYSSQRAAWDAITPPANFFLLERTTADLEWRINARVHAMFKNGLVEEVRGLQEALRANPQARQGLGYRQVLDHLDGAASLEETLKEVALRTRQFARRQQTWFRREPGLQVLSVPEGRPASDLLAPLLGRLK